VYLLQHLPDDWLFVNFQATRSNDLADQVFRRVQPWMLRAACRRCEMRGVPLTDDDVGLVDRARQEGESARGS
jgi:hypothetical protein